MADAMMKPLGEANGVKWYWAEPGRFEKPGVYYWDGTRNVLCVPYPAQQAGHGEAVEWGHTKTAGQLIRQLQTFDPDTPITAACHTDYEGKRVALARPVVLSRERVAGRFIRQGDESVPYSLVIWSQQDEATTPPAPQQPEALAKQERDREDAERWRAFIGLEYKVRMEWACNLSLVPVLIEWVDRIRAARSSEGGQP